MHPIRTGDTTPAAAAPKPLAVSVGRGGADARIQAVLFALLAWAALLCTGFGGAVGVASQSLANKLAGNAQHFQRHGGTSLAARALRRDQAAASSVRQVAEGALALVMDPADEAVPASHVRPRHEAQSADEPRLAATEPRPAPRHRAHLSRAPPPLA